MGRCQQQETERVEERKGEERKREINKRRVPPPRGNRKNGWRPALIRLPLFHRCPSVFIGPHFEMRRFHTTYGDGYDCLRNTPTETERGPTTSRRDDVRQADLSPKEDSLLPSCLLPAFLRCRGCLCFVNVARVQLTNAPSRTGAAAATVQTNWSPFGVHRGVCLLLSSHRLLGMSTPVRPSPGLVSAHASYFVYFPIAHLPSPPFMPTNSPTHFRRCIRVDGRRAESRRQVVAPSFSRLPAPFFSGPVPLCCLL